MVSSNRCYKDENEELDFCPGVDVPQEEIERLTAAYRKTWSEERLATRGRATTKKAPRHSKSKQKQKKEKKEKYKRENATIIPEIFLSDQGIDIRNFYGG